MKLGNQTLAVVLLSLTLGHLTLATAGEKKKNISSDIRQAKIDKRQANQDLRISRGIKSRELSGAEQNVLEKREARIDKYEAKIAADGVITNAEAKKMDKLQDNASQAIYKQKHDDQKIGKNPEHRSNKRLNRQDERIQHGIEKGYLTKKEAANLLAEQKKIENFREKAMKDGQLSKKEAKKLEKKQDVASKRIYRKKHNEAGIKGPDRKKKKADEVLVSNADVGLSDSAVALEGNTIPVVTSDQPAARQPASVVTGAH